MHDAIVRTVVKTRYKDYLVKMKQISSHGLSCILLFVCLFGMALSQSTTDYSNTDCIVDKALPPASKGNYVDCNTDEMKAANTTKCCKRDTTVGCCKPGGSWTMLIVIMCIIGGVSIALAIACFIVYWCDEETFPCLANNKCYQRMKHTDCCNCLEKRRLKKEKERELREKQRVREEQDERDRKAQAIQERQKHQEEKEENPFTDDVQDDFFG